MPRPRKLASPFRYFNLADWLLNDATDVRSSFYLEEVASEFDVQGLELDWAGVCWDGDFHYHGEKWMTQSFRGAKWQSVNDGNRKLYLKNAYRVLLACARQCIVSFVPCGDPADYTRPVCFYDGMFNYLRRCGLPEVVALRKATSLLAFFLHDGAKRNNARLCAPLALWAGRDCPVEQRDIKQFP